MTDAREWWWCLRHGRVEQDPDVRAAERLGPYESAEAAADWQSRSEAQNKRWDDDDERWREGREPSRPSPSGHDPAGRPNGRGHSAS